MFSKFLYKFSADFKENIVNNFDLNIKVGGETLITLCSLSLLKSPFSFPTIATPHPEDRGSVVFCCFGYDSEIVNFSLTS